MAGSYACPARNISAALRTIAPGPEFPGWRRPANSAPPYATTNRLIGLDHPVLRAAAASPERRWRKSASHWRARRPVGGRQGAGAIPDCGWPSPGNCLARIPRRQDQSFRGGGACPILVEAETEAQRRQAQRIAGGRSAESARRLVRAFSTRWRPSKRRWISLTRRGRVGFHPEIGRTPRRAAQSSASTGRSPTGMRPRACERALPS